MNANRVSVVSTLKACIISSPKAIPATALNNDYKSLVGENIPFKKLGYANLEEFLLSVNEIDVEKIGGEYYVKVKSSADTIHISSLVRGQKKTTKKPKRASFPSRYNFSPQSYNRQRRVPNPIPHFMQTSHTSSVKTSKPLARCVPLESNGAVSQSKPYNYEASQPFKPTSSIAPHEQYAKPYGRDVPFRVSEASTQPKQSFPTIPPASLYMPEPSRQAALQPVKIPSTAKEHSVQSSLPPAKGPSAPLKQPASSSQNTHRPTAPGPHSKPPHTAERQSVALRLLKYRREDDTETSTAPAYQLESNGATKNQNKAPSYAKSTSSSVTFVDPVNKYASKYHPKTSESGNHSCIYEIETSTDENSYQKKLIRYAEEHNWPKPDFFVLMRRVGPRKRQESRFMGRVIVCTTPVGQAPPSQGTDCFEYSSYPDELPNVEQALNVVAEKAYKSLITKAAIILPETKDKSLILKRVGQIVKGKEQGIWIHQVEKTYQDMFQESLPADLPALLEQSATIEVSKLTESFYTVRPKTQEKFLSPVYVNNLTVSKLTYPTEDEWAVFVSRIKSTNEIYVRIIGELYSDQYENLVIDMETYYFNSAEKIDHIADIAIGKYYAYVTKTDCCRVLVTNYSEADYYLVYLIDIGEVDSVPASTLRRLLPEFYSLPAQAILCFLDGLDEYDFLPTDPDIQKALIDNVLAKSFASLVSSRNPMYITLIDTSVPEQININDFIKKEVEKSFSRPRLTEVGSLKEIIVTVVDQSGQVHIQIPSWSLECLNAKMNQIANGCYEMAHPRSYKDVKPGLIYIWSNQPSRVKVLNIDANGLTDIEFIDTGDRATASYTELCLIKPLDELLSSHIPPQAIPVLLHDVNRGLLTEAEAKKFLNLVNANSDASSIAKVIAFQNDVPVIEIFVRTSKERLLISINQNLAIDESAVASTVNNDAYSVCTALTQAEAVFHKGAADLKVGEEVDIYVSNVASPDNFTVTLLKFLVPLNSLTHAMLIYYSTTNVRDLSTLKVGEHVAAMKDNCWYRVQIEKHIGNDLYYATYLDRGCMETFNAKNIRVLADQFKKLPYLAYKAKLHGIKPVHGDWEVADCMRLKQLIHEKKFVSNVRDIIHDKNSKRLSLEIIDTSTPEDIYISQLFIQENRALPVNG